MGMSIDFNVRNLINIGVFSAIYFAVVYACGFIGFGGPLFVVLSYLLAALVCGPVVMLFLARTPTAWALTLFGAINGVLFVVAGFPWHVGVGLFVLALVADVIAMSGQYRSPTKNMIAYAVLSMWFVLPFLPILINADAYFAEVAERFNSPEYAASMADFYKPWVIYAWFVGEFVVGAIGGWLGVQIFNKHFVKAGLAG